MLDKDGILYRICTWIYELAILNMLFLVSCIPIITIFPATAATIGIAREWINKKNPPIFSTFYRLFHENFKQSLGIGIVMTIMGLVLIVDFYLLNRNSMNFTLPIISAVCLVSVCFLLSVLYIFPLMVNSHYTVKVLLTTSIKFGLYKLHLTITNVIILVAWFVVSIKYSFLFIFFFFSVNAFLTYWITDTKLKTLQREQKNISCNSAPDKGGNFTI